MSWMPGAWRHGLLRCDRTPQEAGKVPYTLTPATRRQFEAVLSWFELNGRRALEVHEIREIMDDPKALLGEH